MSINKSQINKDVCDFIYSDQIYFNSNERLNDIYNNFDFNDKTIFSVLGSGDQAFHLINRGAKRVDLFDMNKMAIYYFYLRIWMIKYLDMYYYNKHLRSELINALLKLVIPQNSNEEEALYFWKKLMEKNIFNDYEGLIFTRSCSSMKNNKIDNLTRIRDYLENNEFEFNNIDISDNISFNRKYDYLILSNIAEWLSWLDYKKIWEFVRNVDGLLKDDGIAICSTLGVDDCDKRVRDVFDRMFSINSVNDDCKYFPGYYLKKK